MADGLSPILNHSVLANEITPIKVCRRAPGISHLLFVDDTMLFFKASRVQAERIKHALGLYSNATGQSLNFNKCSILFGSSGHVLMHEEVREALNVTTLVFEEKYLGLPTPDG